MSLFLVKLSIETIQVCTKYACPLSFLAFWLVKHWIQLNSTKLFLFTVFVLYLKKKNSKCGFGMVFIWKEANFCWFPFITRRLYGTQSLMKRLLYQVVMNNAYCIFSIQSAEVVWRPPSWYPIHENADPQGFDCLSIPH